VKVVSEGFGGAARSAGQRFCRAPARAWSFCTRTPIRRVATAAVLTGAAVGVCAASAYLLYYYLVQEAANELYNETTTSKPFPCALPRGIGTHWSFSDYIPYNTGPLPVNYGKALIELANQTANSFSDSLWGWLLKWQEAGNPPLGGEERAEALKIHVGFCHGFLCGACLSASHKLDMTVFNELWARGNWDAIVHVVADKGYDCSSLTRSYQKTGEIPVIPRRKGAIYPGVSDRERYKTRHTVERFFVHVKEHKRLITRFDKLDATFFSFFALACLNVFKALC